MVHCFCLNQATKEELPNSSFTLSFLHAFCLSISKLSVLYSFNKREVKAEILMKSQSKKVGLLGGAGSSGS